MAQTPGLEDPVPFDDATAEIPIDEEVLDADVIVLLPAGELDMLTTPALRQRVIAELGRRRNVVLDLSEITFLSSGGIQMLVEAHQNAQENGSALHISGATNRVVARPLEITGVEEILNLSGEPAAELATRLVGELVPGSTTAQRATS